jgi:hypothetical protein
MRPGRWAAFFSFAAGCASGAGTADAPRTPKDPPQMQRSLPIPADLAPQVQEAIDLGRQLYVLDKASAIGTDALRENVPDFASRGLGGWITLQNGDEQGKALPSFSVLFSTKDEPLRLVFSVSVPLRGKPTFKERSPPQMIEEFGVRLFRARQTALEAAPPSSRPFNPVILAGDAVGRPDAIVVYLLAAEQRADEMVFGIHYRALVSADGLSVKQLVPLSRSALVLPVSASADAPFVTQVVTDCPSEVHVFVSLLHNRTPLIVGTRRGLWRVVGDQIALIDDKAPK